MKRDSASYRTVAALLALCYLVSLCGFNIHRDYVCGKAYFSMLPAGTSCSDIHPESPCRAHSADGLGPAAEHSPDGNGDGTVYGHCRHCSNESALNDSDSEVCYGANHHTGAVYTTAQHCSAVQATKTCGKYHGTYGRQTPSLSFICVSKT